MAPTLDWLKRLIASVIGSKDTSRPTNRSENVFPRIYETRLEERRVLNAGAIVSAADMLALQFDAGQSANDGIADKFELARVESAPEQITVSINDRQVWQGNASQVQSIRFDGSTDVDRFVIDSSIALPSGIYINGDAASNASYVPSAGDVVVLATADNQQFEEITYQTTDSLTQVRLANPTQSAESLIHIAHVSSIIDSNQAASRQFVFESNDPNLTLQNVTSEVGDSNSTTLELSSNQTRIAFTEPTSHLRVESRANGQSQSYFTVDATQLSNVRSVELLGNDLVTIRQTGVLTIGDTLSIHAGNIDVTGEIRGNNSQIELMATNRIHLVDGSIITNDGGIVRAVASDITASGQISTGATGVIQLDAEDGTVIVNGTLLSRGNATQRGGQIYVTGDEVTLRSTAIVDASGGLGGGTIRIGGGYRGSEAGIRNSRQTIIEKDATLTADATLAGNGGSIVVWADDSTYVYDAQTITTRGGAVSGNGGLIETSGKRYLYIRGAASTAAEHGDVGTWLLDPDNVLVVATAGPVVTGTTYFLISTIVSGLATNNVVIETSNIAGGDGDITIVDPVVLAPSNVRTLTITATRDIIFQSGLSATGNLNVVLNAGRDVNSSAATLGQMASLTISAEENVAVAGINLAGGSLSVTIDSNNNQSARSFTSTGNISASTITINGTSSNDTVSVNGTLTSTTGAIQFNSLDTITFAANVSSATNITFTNVDGPLNLGSNVSVTSGSGTLNFSTIASGMVLTGINGSTNTITANGATGSLTLANVTSTNSNVSLELNSATGLTANSINIQTGKLDVLFNTQNTNAVKTASFQAITSGALFIGGNSQANDRIQLNGVVTSSGTFKAIDYGDLDINATVNATSNITLTGISNSNTHLSANIISSGGNIAISGGILLIDGASTRNIRSGGTANNVATGGSITIGTIGGETSAADLSIDARGSSTSGTVNLGDVTSTGTGVNQLTIRTDATNRGQVTVHDIRLLSKGATAAALKISSNGLDIIADGSIDLSSTTTVNGGSADFGTSAIIPIASNSTLSIDTSSSAGNGGDVTLKGIANNGANYFDVVRIDTIADLATKTSGDLNFSATANPSIAVDGTSGLGILLSGTVLKSFTGTLNLLTNPGNIAQNTSDIDITKADFKTTLGLNFDTSGNGTALNAGDVFIGDLGIAVSERPTSLTVDTRGATSNGSLFVNNQITGSTEIHVDGTINVTGVTLDDSALFRSYSNSSMSLGAVALATATPRDLTLNSQANISLSSVQIGSGVFAATIDSNSNQSNVLFQSTGNISAGTISFTGSSSNDDVSLGGSVTSTVGAISFSSLDDVSFFGNVSSASSITFTNVSGPLLLGTNANITSGSGSLNFSTISGGILLGGTNPSINVISATGATGSLTLAPVTATNTNVSLTLNSSTDITADDIDIQSGTLSVRFNSLNANANNVASFALITAGNLSIVGGAQADDDILLNGAVNIDGVVLIDDYSDLIIDASINAASDVAITGIAGSKTHLVADIVSAGGDILITGGTLFVDGATARSIKSGGTAQSVAAGGNIQIGTIDGENGAADLTVDSRGSTSAGTVVLGSVTASTSGLNRLTVLTNATTAAQVQLSGIRLVSKSPNTASALTVNSGGLNILASGTIDLSATTINGGSINFGSSIVTPNAANDTLTLKTNSTSGDGGDITLGGVGNNGALFFDQLSIDTNATSALKSDGDLSFNSVNNPVLAIDGTTGTGITLVGTIIKSFTGTLTLRTNPLGVSQTSTPIDVSQANINFAGNFNFDTSGGNQSTTAGNVVFADIGTTTQILALAVDTRGTTSTGLLKLNDGVPASTTDIRSTGNIDLTNTITELSDNVLIESSGAATSISIGTVTTNASAQNLTLRSNGNVNVTGNVTLTGGTFTANVDFNDDQAGALFQSSTGISAGSITISGSAAGNDDVSLATGVTASTTQSTSGSIAFQNIRTLTLQHVLKSKTTISGTNIGKVVLNGSAIVEAENDIDLSTSIGQIELAGTNGTTNIIRTITGNGSISLASVSTTNVASTTNVGLTIQSQNRVTANAIELHSGALNVTFDNSLTNSTATATFSTINAGTVSVSGNSRVNDKILLNGAVTAGSGGVSLTQYNELEVNSSVTSNGGLTFTGITGSITHLVSDVSTNGGNIAITGGTLLVNGSSVRRISSGNAAAATGGSITLGTIDGEVSAAELEINSKGTATAGNVTLGTVQITGSNKGLNRLLIQTDSPSAGQVSLSDIRLVNNGVTSSSLTVQANGRAILANGTIDLSSSTVNRPGGAISFGTSLVTPKTGSSTLNITTANTNATSGADGSNGGNISFGGVGVNGSAYFNSVSIDTRATDPLDTAGTISFLGSTSPAIAVDGTSGTGITLSGNVNNAAGTTLNLRTNPAAANQVTSSIDISRANFIGTGGLVLDTSGGNNATTAGNISMGDLGVTVRPVSLIVDTRGTVSSGHLILNDNVGASTTEIHIDGTIDLSGATLELADNVLIQAHGDGNNVTIGNTIVTGGARNLTLLSDSNIFVSAITLAGGNLNATIDANANDIPALFQSTGAINVGELTVTGNAVRDDLAVFGGSITTASAANILNFNQVDLNNALIAGTTANIAGISGALRLGTSASIRANATIDLRSTVNSIVLSGNTGATNVVEAHGASSSVNLGPITTINPGVNLTVQSDYKALLDSATLTDGVLTISFGRGNANADATALLSTVTAKGLSVTGTNTASDSVQLNGAVTVGTSGLIAQQIAQIDVNANIQSAGVITVNNVTGRIRLADSVSLIADGVINMQTGVSSVQLLGASGSLNLIQSNSDAGTLRLGATTATNDVNLQIDSSNSIDLTSADVNNGSLLVNVDTNNNSNSARLDSGSLKAGQITIAGRAAANDTVVINGVVESRVGSITMNQFGTVTFNQNVTAATSLQMSQITSRIDVGSGRTIQSLNGDLNMFFQVGAIRFIGGAATTSSLRAANGNLHVAPLTEQSTSSLIDVRTDRDVLLETASLNSAMQITAGDHNSAIGTIHSNGSLAATSLTLSAATGIGSITPLITSTGSITATNRLTGDIRILNSKTGSDVIANIVANQGGNIDLQNSGGSTLRISNASTAADATPALNEANIHFQNNAGALIVESSGISAAGLGSVNLETVTSGDVQLNAIVQSPSGPTNIVSAQRIFGTGSIQSASIDLQATTGIGGLTPLQTRTSQLEATTTTGIINITNTSSGSVNVSNLATDVTGSINFRQTGGGDLSLARVATGAVASPAGSNIVVNNDAGSIFVLGDAVAGGTGSIVLTASNNLILGPGARIETQGTAATIQGTAGGQFQLQPGATVRAGSSNTATEALISRLPTLVQVRPVVNFLGVNVDSLGVASIQLQLGGPNPPVVDKNFSVIIDWGDGQIDTLPNGTISNGTINPNITRFDASGAIYQITHQYLGNPNPNDPIAKIPVRVTVGVDALNRIQFNDSVGASSSLVQIVDEKFEVPAAGLFSLRFDIPQTPSVPTRLVFNSSLAIANVAAPNATAKPADIQTSSSDSSAEQERSYVLRIVTPIDEQGGVKTSEDIELSEDDIDDLSQLFLRLGDNRYRIYLIREDGVRLMLKDFYLRDHRPIEIEDSQPPSAETTNDRVLESMNAATMLRIDAPRTDAESADSKTGSENFSHNDNAGVPVTVGNSVTAGDAATSGNAATVGNTVTAGLSLTTVRSWRKAARRFRAN